MKDTTLNWLLAICVLFFLFSGRPDNWDYLSVIIKNLALGG